VSCGSCWGHEVSLLLHIHCLMMEEKEKKRNHWFPTNYSKKERKKEKKQEIDAKKRKTWNEDEKRNMKTKDTVNQCPTKTSLEIIRASM
jgi:hypothetical protein